MEYVESRRVSPVQREAMIDRYMNLAIFGLLALVLVASAVFGLMVWRESQVQRVSAPAQRVIDDVANSVRQFPNNAALRVRLGEAYAAAGLYDEAVEQFDNAIKIDERHTGAYLDLGYVAVAQEDWAKAEKYFKKVIELTGGESVATTSSHRETAYFNLGQIALEEKRYEDAVGYLKASLRIRKDASDSYYQLARAYSGLGEGQAALDQLEIALRYDPNFAEAHYEAGRIYLDQKEWLNAATHLRTSIELAPEADPPAEAMAALGDASEWIDKAKKAEADGKLPEAADFARIAFLVDPQSADAGKLVGSLLSKTGDTDGAIAAYEDVLKIAPDDKDAKAALEKLKAESAKNGAKS